MPSLSPSPIATPLLALGNFSKKYTVLLTVKQASFTNRKNSMSHHSYQNRLQPNINLLQAKKIYKLV